MVKKKLKICPFESSHRFISKKKYLYHIGRCAAHPDRIMYSVEHSEDYFDGKKKIPFKFTSCRYNPFHKVRDMTYCIEEHYKTCSNAQRGMIYQPYEELDMMKK